MIKVCNLFKSYKDNIVIDDLSFEVKEGTIFTLLGQNGAGKSTIVKILSTILDYDSGKIMIDQHDLSTETKKVREVISLTGQDMAVDEMLSAYENLKMIEDLRGIKKCNSKIMELLAMFELSDVKDKQVKYYSGGMKRKVDIAMGLVGDPKLIFLDEPTTGLDPKNRLLMWHFIKRLANEKKTIFLTTQYLEEAEFLSDHIVILKDGKIINQGSVKNIKEILPSFGAKLEFNDEVEALKALDILKNEGIRDLTYYKNMPSLEDVFLKVLESRGERDV